MEAYIPPVASDRHIGEPDDMCDRVCCSDFVHVPDPDEGKGWDFDLTNDILPCLLPVKFRVLVSRPDGYGMMHREQIEKIKPALRLASRMLQDDRAVHFICTMFDGTLHADESEDSPELQWEELEAEEPPLSQHFESLELPKKHLTRRPREMDAVQARLRSRAILNKLAHVIKWIKFTEDDAPPPEWDAAGDGTGPASGTYVIDQVARWRLLGLGDIKALFLKVPEKSNGSTGYMDPQELDPRLRAEFPRALGAGIYLSASKFELHKDKPSGMSQYLLARCLVHEIGHVLNKMANGQREHEVFYAHSRTNEMGFELETALFGGPYEQWDLNVELPERYIDEGLRQITVLEWWPSIRTYQTYKGQTYNFLRRGPDSGDLATMCTRIPQAFLAKMCTDDFWNEREALSAASSELNEHTISPNLDDSCHWFIEFGDDGSQRFCELSDEKILYHVRQWLWTMFKRKVWRNTQAEKEKIQDQAAAAHRVHNQIQDQAAAAHRVHNQCMDVLEHLLLEPQE